MEAQWRGTSNPHVLMWVLHRRQEQFERNVYAWMKATIAASESNSKSSVRSAARRFGELVEEGQPLVFSDAEQRLSIYDGGSEISILEAVDASDRTEAQSQVLRTESAENWYRPCLELRDVAGNTIVPGVVPDVPRESIYAMFDSRFAVAKCPSYRRPGSHFQLTEESRRRLGTNPSGKRSQCKEQWQTSFVEDVRSLAPELLVYVCGESCFKYSGRKKQRTCRYGFYNIYYGKAVRNVHGTQGRILPLQKHPFEMQTNCAAVSALRCNFDGRLLCVPFKTTITTIAARCQVQTAVMCVSHGAEAAE